MAGVFTEKQFDLLIEVTEVYRIPSVVKRAMKLYLVDGKTREESCHKGVVDIENLEVHLDCLRETYTMSLSHQYPKNLGKRTLSEELFSELGELVQLTNNMRDKLRPFLVTGTSNYHHIKKDQNAKIGFEMLQEVVNDINHFRESVSGDINHQKCLMKSTSNSSGYQSPVMAV